MAKPEDIELWPDGFTPSVLTLSGEGLLLRIPLWILGNFQMRSKVPSYLSGPFQGATEPLGLGENYLIISLSLVLFF